MEHQVFDRLVYGKVREAMGGRVRYAMSGGSAMSRRLGLFFDGAGITVFEGYGLTESSAAATANPPGATKYGTVGRPIPGSSVHIAQDGEVWLFGAHVFSGYLGDPRATEAVLRGGWLATGDLGRLDEDGYLVITGRKKDILVTSNGKSVAPAAWRSGSVRIRSWHSACWWATTVRTSGPCSRWTRRAWRTGCRCAGDADAGCGAGGRPGAHGGGAAGGGGRQHPGVAGGGDQAFRVLGEQFTEERGLLTPSLKLKRRAIEKAYAREVAALYGPGHRN